MKDHVMMFLGKVENEYFVIHLNSNITYLDSLTSTVKIVKRSKGQKK